MGLVVVVGEGCGKIISFPFGGAGRNIFSTNFTQEVSIKQFEISDCGDKGLSEFQKIRGISPVRISSDHVNLKTLRRSDHGLL